MESNHDLWTQSSIIQHNGATWKAGNEDRDRRRNVITGDGVEKKKSKRSLRIYAVPLRSCPKKHVLT